MTTDNDTEPDEIALPRFEELLRRRLVGAHHDHASGPVARGGPLHARRARRSLLLGTGAVAAAAVLVVAVVARSDDGDPGGDVTTRSAAEPATSGGPDAPRDLSTRIVAAVEEAEATMVVHVLQDNTSYGDDETWTDETTGAYRFLQLDDDGEPSYDSGSDPATPSLVRTVDYCFSEWSENEAGLPSGPGSSTRWVGNYLAWGWLVEDGTEVVDGRELIRLREVPASERPLPPSDGEATFSGPRQLDESTEEDPTVIGPADPAAPTTTAPAPPAGPEDALRSAQEDAEALAAAESEAAAAAAEAETPPADESELGVTLVDPETYRPVKVYGYPGSDAAYVQTYEYLPRTPETLASLPAPVPDGFTRVDELRGDGERFDAGCG